jgi:O-antigen/teichoic acid export membrane protein
MIDSYPSQDFIKDCLKRLRLDTITGPVLLSFLNQFIGGGGNFLISVYLARTLGLDQFGLYGIGFGVCMLYVGVGNAVILTQMVVNMADKSEDKRAEYAEGMLLSVCLLGASLFFLVAIASGLLALFMPDFVHFLPVVFSIAIASVTLLGAEFFICHAFLRRRESLAAAVNGVTMLTIFFGFGIARLYRLDMSANRALLLYAAGTAISCFFAYLASPLKLRLRQPELFQSISESWAHGRWALGGVALTWLQSQSYGYILAVYLGPAGIGLANAARIFVSPFTFLLTSINKVAIPRMVDLRDSNRAEMFRISMLLAGGLIALTSLYSLILLSSTEFASRIVLGRYEPAIMSVVWIWCLLLIVQVARSCGGVLLQVQRKFRLLTLVNIPSVIVTLLLSILLIRWFGVAGAILGLFAGETTLLVLIWREIYRDRIRM